MHFEFAFRFRPLKILGFICSVQLRTTQIFLLLLLSSFPVFAMEMVNAHMRGERYCEIILSRLITNYAIYNTLGLNDCPSSWWEKLTSAQVKKDTGYSFVFFNGPRFWVIDGFNNPNGPVHDIKTINGFSMQEAGQLYIKFTDLFKAKSPYYKHEVKRQTIWFYESGRPIYELIDDKGEVYVMQSFSAFKESQSERSLAELGAQLNLPKGWVFKTGRLKQPETIRPINNVAIVVQDNLENSYQKVTHDLLENEKNTPSNIT